MNRCRLWLSTLFQLPNWTMELTRATLSVRIALVLLCHTHRLIPSVLIINHMADIIGVVKEDEGIQEIVSKASGKPVSLFVNAYLPYLSLTRWILQVKKRQLTVVDMSKKQIKLTLWDRQAENFDSSNFPVVACKGCRVSDFGGRSLSMSSSGSLKINPEIPEAKQLRQW